MTNQQEKRVGRISKVHLVYCDSAFCNFPPNDALIREGRLESHATHGPLAVQRQRTLAYSNNPHAVVDSAGPEAALRG